MICSKCNKEERFFAYLLQINNERRQVCIDCYRKEPFRGNSTFIDKKLLEMMKDPDTNMGIAISLIYQDEKEKGI